MGVTHKPKAGGKLTGTEYEAADSHVLAIADGDIPSTIARDSEVTAAISALSSVYQPLDSDLTSIAALTTTAFGRGLLELANAAALLAAAGGAAASHAHSGNDITSGTVADARIDAAIARDSEVTAAISALSSVYQPLDSDLTSIAALTTTAFGRGLLELADAAAWQASSAMDGVFGPHTPPPSWVGASDLVTQFEEGHGWSGSAGFATSTTDYITGVQSVYITTAGTGAYKIESGEVSLDLTQKQLRLRIKVDDVTNVNSVNVYAGNDSSYTDAYKWFVIGTLGSAAGVITSGGTTPHQGWVHLVLNVADAQVVGSPTRTGIVRIKADISRTAAAGEVTLRLDEVDLVPEAVGLFPNGAVVICFDDILESSWSLAKPYLDTYRYRASHFVIMDQVGQSGRVTLDQLRVMRDEGHDINAHAYTGAHHTAGYTGITAAELDADLRAQKAWLRTYGFRGDATAYPLGAYGTTSDGANTHAIVSRYFAGARTTSAGTNKPNATFPLGDPYRIPALSSITDFTGGFTPANLMSAGVGGLDSVKAAHGIKVLTFHKLVAGSPAALTEIKASDFGAIIDHIAGLGMQVLTMGEYLRLAAGASTVGTPALTLGTTNAAGSATTSVGTGATIAVFDTTAPSPDSGAAPATGSNAFAARSDHVHPRRYWEPADHGLIAWPYDPALAASSTALATAGTVYVIKVHVPVAASVTNIITQVTTAGSSLTSNQCFAGLYQGGTLLGATADQSTAWGSNGVKTMAISGGPVAVAAGDAYIAFLFNGTTGPTLPRSNGNALINVGITATASRFGTANTSQTSLPGTLGTVAALSVSYWAGLS